MTKRINGWNKHQLLVLAKLDSYGNSIRSVHKEITAIKIEIARLQVKSGIWGLLGGCVPVVLWLLLKR